MLNQCSAVPLAFQVGDERFGSTPETISGRSVAARLVSAESPVVDGVSGEPLRAWNTVPSSQSRVRRFRTPFPTPRLMITVDRLKRCGRSAMHGPSFVEGSLGSGKMLM